jgi:hypothetical protein
MTTPQSKRAALLFLLELSDPAIKLPQLDIVAVHQLLGLSYGRVIVCAKQINPPQDVAIRAYDIRAILIHFGEAKPGERSHSFIREAVSACCALRKIMSRALLPKGSFSASSLNRRACSASRSSKVNVCLTRRRT